MLLRPSLFRDEFHFSDYVAESLPKVTELKDSQNQYIYIKIILNSFKLSTHLPDVDKEHDEPNAYF